MNITKDVLWFGCMILLLFLSCGSTADAQDKKVPVEPWEERLNRQHKPVQLMDAMGLDKGMVIADIGAGRGRMTVFFAQRVGRKGMVLANDINSGALIYLEDRCKRNDIGNVKTYLGTVTDPRLPDGKADILFMVSTYHHLEKPVVLMRNALPALKPDGRLIIVERDPEKTGQTSSESTSRALLIRQMTEAGYEHLDTDIALLERDNIYYFRTRENGGEQ
jgi:ubiquinone/menaquinone biosynthesis C-methylase UbiE